MYYPKADSQGLSDSQDQPLVDYGGKLDFPGDQALGTPGVSREDAMRLNENVNQAWQTGDNAFGDMGTGVLRDPRLNITPGTMPGESTGRMPSEFHAPGGENKVEDADVNDPVKGHSQMFGNPIPAQGQNFSPDAYGSGQPQSTRDMWMQGTGINDQDLANRSIGQPKGSDLSSGEVTRDSLDRLHGTEDSGGATASPLTMPYSGINTGLVAPGGGNSSYKPATPPPAVGGTSTPTNPLMTPLTGVFTSKPGSPIAGGSS